MSLSLFQFGAVSITSCILINAYGAHTNLKKGHANIMSYNRAATYQMVHSLALMYLSTLPGPRNELAIYLLAIGMVVFSGSIYTRVLQAPDVSSNNEVGKELFGLWAALTPPGIIMLTAGWGVLAWYGP